MTAACVASSNKSVASALAGTRQQYARVVVCDLAQYEPEQLLAEPPESLLIVLVSTYEGGTPPEAARFFCSWLEEASTDFRVGAAALNKLQFAAWGCGNSLYAANFNAVARRVERQLLDLGARRFSALGLGDEDADMLQQFQRWAAVLTDKLAGQKQLQAVAKHMPAQRPVGLVQEQQREGVSSGVATTRQEQPRDDDGMDDDELSDDGGEEDAAGSEVDIEDLGGPSGKDEGEPNAPRTPATKPEMVTPLIRGSLTKQGYKIIGSHSGVKMCRWTKSMLRGRGGCYKHAFYGIESHRCMEATPSLACANKCVFCWRHHSNPVGREWKWAMDPPEQIVGSALEQHRRMVREYAGVPGVQAKAVAEGLQVRHCALSLVGEPIMYPEINTLVGLLHERRISTFLVTNAQFPDCIQKLKPITQLYVSVDAATPESLKAVDRPLFSDYWERFTSCLRSLHDKRQRTVYRLTLVKGWNMAEVQQYADLVDLGRPDFIEIKGVTYCGSGAASTLTMANVPYHQDVVDFGQAICAARAGEYGLACEHAHSCCILLARRERFYRDGLWHTWIDYDKFQDLVAAGASFGTEDYMLATPPWATFGAPEAGFDPGQTRIKKARNHPGRSDAASSVAEAADF